MIPDSNAPTRWDEEPAVFENWQLEGCYVLVEGKHVLTLNTPETTREGDPYNTLLDDWISPEEFCETLKKVLCAFGASEKVIAAVENERLHYREVQIQPPSRTNAQLMAEIGVAI